MDFLTLLEIFNYALALIFGVLLSTYIAGGWETRQEKRLIIALCPLLLLVQSLFGVLWGVDAVKKLYPLIAHLPLVLLLVFALKKRWQVALFSICTAYLCCQLPRWINILIAETVASPLAGEIGYALAIIPTYLLLRHYFVQVANYAMIQSPKTLLLFGSLPFGYYLVEYAFIIFGDALPALLPALIDFFTTALIIFYLITFAAYHAQKKRQTLAEQQNSLLKAELKQAGSALESLRSMETHAAVYQHNMRHHLTAISAFLSAGKTEQAQEYIRNVQTDVEAITPKHFCENELLNLLCSSFSSKAEHSGIQLAVNAKLPQNLPVSDTELCSILSNGFENALHTVSNLEASLKWIELYCTVRMGKFLIEIRNPYVGKIDMRDGLPVTNRGGHGYGCRSIRTITEQNGGLCLFEAEHGVFVLRVAIPVSNTTN